MPCHRIARLALLLCLAAPVASRAADAPQEPAARPNILWISCEDISANLGCYGDPDASTPRLDQLATEGVRYARAFATIGVCAPARSTIITGMYPPSIGTQHMRCRGTLPEAARCFTEYLREAGYYCTNNVKTDYNFKHPASAWDESSRQAHWRNREPGQPFFAVFNFTTTHESRIRQPDADFRRVTADLAPEQRHDPAQVQVPPYHPDTPEVRQDWARYHDLISVMDAEVGAVLDELAEDGLADDTIVMYFSDHGAGMPRSKRWLYDSSIHVPLLVRFGKNYANHAPHATGETTERLVSFVDFAPTALSLAGLAPPEMMQGEAFLGSHATEPRDYIYGFRDRMDERSDMLRAVRDERYKYIRNWRPYLPWFQEQHLSYMQLMPTMQVWQRMADAGELSGTTAIFMAPHKPVEELYDTWEDPWEVNNLANDPAQQATLQRLRQEAEAWSHEIIDLGFLPEADLRSRFGDRPPYDAVRTDPSSYPLDRILGVARQAAQLDPDADRLLQSIDDGDPAVRYWVALGLGSVREPSREVLAALKDLERDEAVTVRIAAAESLGRQGHGDEVLDTLAGGLRDENPWARLQAAEVIDRLRPRTPAATKLLESARGDDNEYVVRIAKSASEDR